LALAVLGLACSAGPVHAQVIARVNVATDGTQSNSFSTTAPALSGDGASVAFASDANTLVPGDTNGVRDVFVRDWMAGVTTRVSVATGGGQANGRSGDFTAPPAISSNGRIVAFSSEATNLVAGCGATVPFRADLFVHDRQTGITTCITPGSSEGLGPVVPRLALSADGRFVAFSSRSSNLVAGDTNGQTDLFVHDRQTSTTTRVSVATGGGQAAGVPPFASFAPSLSADGRFVAFESDATNLVPGDTNGQFDVFVHDRQTTTTTRVSVATGGGQALGGGSHTPALSADGRFVAFSSAATNLVPGDTNGVTDVFVHDRQTATTTRVSVHTSGAQALNQSDTPSISGDGRFVAFTTVAPNLVDRDTNGTGDVFVHDRQAGTTVRVNLTADGFQANSGSFFGVALSFDGSLAVFDSFATNLVSGDTNAFPDLFVAGTAPVPAVLPPAPGGGGGQVIGRLSVASDGTPGNGSSQRAAMSGDGRFVAFGSDATNLVPGDTNNATDVFVHDRQTRATTRVSVATAGTQGNGFSSNAVISADGRAVAFVSSSTNISSCVMAFNSRIVVRDLVAGTTTCVSVSNAGVEANDFTTDPGISADGRFVSFFADASNLVPGCGGFPRGSIFVHDRVEGTTECVSVGSDGTPNDQTAGHSALSLDGRFVAFTARATNLVPGDTNGVDDVFVRDRLLGLTTRVSVATGGGQANGSSLGAVGISADGRFVAFVSVASNLVAGCGGPGKRDIFVHDRETGLTECASVAADGTPGDGESESPALSVDGRFVAFASNATNLVFGDTNRASDVFVRDRLRSTTTRVSVSLDGQQANGFSFSPGIGAAADLRLIVFDSHSDNLVPGDTNFVADIFVARLAVGPNWLVTGQGPGALARVQGFDAGGNATPLSPDPAVTGGVHVALADVDGDGAPDLVVGAGAGAPQGPSVRVFTGSANATLTLLADFDANGGLPGGVRVAACNFDGAQDGRAEVVTSPGPGGGTQVRVWRMDPGAAGRATPELS
jgi:Tol biopolymer transport system component